MRLQVSMSSMVNPIVKVQQSLEKYTHGQCLLKEGVGIFFESCDICLENPPTSDFTCSQSSPVDVCLQGCMEKQETERKQKLETETGNGNWKRKWEQKTHQSLVQCFFIVCLVITLVFYLAMVIGLAVWVMSFAFTPVLCFVITAFSVNGQCSCRKQSGSRVRGSWHKAILVAI